MRILSLEDLSTLPVLGIWRRLEVSWARMLRTSCDAYAHYFNLSFVSVYVQGLVYPNSLLSVSFALSHSLPTQSVAHGLTLATQTRKLSVLIWCHRSVETGALYCKVDESTSETHHINWRIVRQAD